MTEQHSKTKKFYLMLNMMCTLIVLMLTYSNSSNSTLGERSLFLCLVIIIKRNKFSIFQQWESALIIMCKIGWVSSFFLISYFILVSFCGLLFSSSLSFQFYLRTLSYSSIAFQTRLIHLKCMYLSVVLKVYIAVNLILPCFWRCENHAFFQKEIASVF